MGNVARDFVIRDAAQSDSNRWGDMSRRFFTGLLILSALGPLPARATGALAVGSQGATGYAQDFPDEKAARDAALQNCPGKCNIVMVLRKSCGAIVVDVANLSGAKGWASGLRPAQAQGNALAQCKKHGGQRCEMKVFACDTRG